MDILNFQAALEGREEAIRNWFERLCLESTLAVTVLDQLPKTLQQQCRQICRDRVEEDGDFFRKNKHITEGTRQAFKLCNVTGTYKQAVMGK